MPKTGENIYKRKDGRWEGRYVKGRENGKIRYGSVYAKSCREVRAKREAARKTYSASKEPVSEEGTVADVGNRWLCEMALTLKESSKNKYEDILKRYIFPRFGNMALSAVTNQSLVRFANELLTEGGSRQQGLASATVAEIFSVLNGIRAYAVRRDFSVSFSTECICVKRSQADIRVFSVEEEERLVRHLLGHMDLSAAGVLLCLFTGIRIGELCALKWDDINLTEKRLYVNKSMQRLRVSETGRTAVKIQKPKSVCSIRVIPLPEAVVKWLEEFYQPEAFFLTGSRERYVEPRTMQNRFKRILSACGLADANFHTTRHTFATRCIELGFDVKSLSEILGHASIAITMNRYVHPSMAVKARNMERFSELFAVR